MKDKKYISTTLPYINSKAHIGHAFEFVLADVITEYYRFKFGRSNVYLNTGIDCFGQKVYDKAILKGFSNPQKYCDVASESWKQFCATLHIDYDNFYRTTDSRHRENVIRFYDEIKEHVFEKDYEGHYCVGCEAFITEKEIVDGCCPIHKQPLEFRKERNKFFALSKFAPQIKDTLIDKSKSAELANLLKEPFDLSITRQNVKWGIPAGDGSVFYCWSEALLNYLFSIKYYEYTERFNSFWGNSLIICGQDNLKFQSLILPALLAANNIPQPKEVLVHGTILDEHGDKMSKSVDNVIDPVEQINKYGVDAVRYYLFFGLNTFSNSKYSEGELVELWNADVVNGLGNLINRLFHIIEKRNVKIDYNALSESSKQYLQNKFGSYCSFAGAHIFRKKEFDTEIDEAFTQYDFKKVRELLNQTIAKLNKRIGDEKPFSKECSNYVEVLTEIYFELLTIYPYYNFVLKEHKEKIENAFIEKKSVILFNKFKIE